MLARRHLNLVDAQRAQPLGAAALEELEKIGVIHDARGVGIFEINAHRPGERGSVELHQLPEASVAKNAEPRSLPARDAYNAPQNIASGSLRPRSTSHASFGAPRINAIGSGAPPTRRRKMGSEIGVTLRAARHPAKCAARHTTIGERAAAQRARQAVTPAQGGKMRPQNSPDSCGANAGAAARNTARFALRAVSHSLAFALAFSLAGCEHATNSPHASGAEKTNTFFTATQERSPKYFDPTASYSLDETPYTYSVYEPPYRFHYLKRPYQVAPRTAEEIAPPKYFDADGHPLPDDAAPERIAEAVYDIHIKPGILFAPHPALAKDQQGNYLYHHLTRKDTAGKRTPFDFPQSGTRELTASDYVYAIRRLATTRIKSPSFSPLSEHILGLKAYGERIAAIDKELRKSV